MHYHFAAKENETFNIIREASEQEYLFLKERLSKIDKMMLDNKRIENYIRCYENIMNQYAKFTREADLREIGEELNAALAAYLGSYKKFSDNWQTAITREYGKDSKELSIFKKAFSDQYDQHMEYRIVYRLRNYDQHCGDIISRITASLEADKPVYKVYMDRDYLLENFGEWKTEEREFLSNCDKLIEILPILKVFHQCVLKAFECIMKIHMNEELNKTCAEILNFTNDISGDDVIYIWTGEVDLKEYTNIKDNISVSITRIDRKLCATILKMYIQSNQHIVKILYHGEKIRKKISDCAIYVDEENFTNVNPKSPFFIINGRRYICLISQIWIMTGDFYGVYADTRIKKEDRDKLSAEFKEYMRALIGK